MAGKVYLIFGDDEYRVTTEAKKLTDSLVPPEDRSFGMEIIDGTVNLVDEAVAATENCISAMLTMGMFGNRKLVWFKNVNFLTDTKTGKSDAVKNTVGRLAEIIKQGIPDDVTLIVSADKVNKRYAFYKACKSVAEIQEFTVPVKQKNADLNAASAIKEFAQKYELIITGGTKEAFLQKVGTNTRQIACEIEKLSSYVGDRKKVTTEDIQAIVSASRQTLAWDIADAVGKRNLPGALAILRQLLFQKESPIALIMAIEGRIRDLMVFREGLGRGWIKLSVNNNFANVTWTAIPDAVETMFAEEFSKDPRTIHPYVQGKLAQQAKNFSRAELAECNNIVIKAYEDLVSSSLGQSMIMEIMLINMLS